MLENIDTWKEEKEVVVSMALAKGYTEEECVAAAVEERRAKILSGKRATSLPELTPEGLYVEAIVKYWAARSKGGGAIYGIPPCLFHKDGTGKVPEYTAGQMIVPVTFVGEQRRAAAMEAARAAVGLKGQDRWTEKSQNFRAGLAELRKVKIAELHSRLVDALQILSIAEAGAKRAPPGAAQKAHNATVTKHVAIVKVLIVRLKAWMEGGFQGLSATKDCPDVWDGDWDEKAIICDKGTPWLGLGSTLAQGKGDLGCASLRGSCLPTLPPFG
jgi:hypothetical protein